MLAPSPPTASGGPHAKETDMAATEVFPVRPLPTALICDDLDAGYAGKPVVWGFNLRVAPGQVVALLGPNGAGKTTVLLTLAGFIPKVRGAVAICEKPQRKASPVAATRDGLVLVPDDRSLFTTLTVRENLILGRRPGGISVDDAVGLFPDLGRRLDLAAGQLSGGEQQMLAIGRALMQGPRVLLIDELSMGLAPVVVQKLLPVVRQVADDTRAGIVLVEQHVRLALGIADHAVVLAHGHTVLTGSASELLADPARLEHAYLGG
jgi:branched-chain amino acid transport system ATP-binding protein